MINFRKQVTFCRISLLFLELRRDVNEAKAGSKAEKHKVVNGKLLRFPGEEASGVTHESFLSSNQASL